MDSALREAKTLAASRETDRREQQIAMALRKRDQELADKTEALQVVVACMEATYSEMTDGAQMADVDLSALWWAALNKGRETLEKYPSVLETTK